MASAPAVSCQNELGFFVSSFAIVSSWYVASVIEYITVTKAVNCADITWPSG